MPRPGTSPPVATPRSLFRGPAVGRSCEPPSATRPPALLSPRSPARSASVRREPSRTIDHVVALGDAWQKAHRQRGVTQDPCPGGKSSGSPPSLEAAIVGEPWASELRAGWGAATPSAWPVRWQPRRSHCGFLQRIREIGPTIARIPPPTPLGRGVRTASPAGGARFEVIRPALLSILDSRAGQNRIGESHNAEPGHGAGGPPCGPFCRLLTQPQLAGVATTTRSVDPRLAPPPDRRYPQRAKRRPWPPRNPTRGPPDRGIKPPARRRGRRRPCCRDSGRWSGRTRRRM